MKYYSLLPDLVKKLLNRMKKAIIAIVYYDRQFFRHLANP
jgi:hypothetical protein